MANVSGMDEDQLQALRRSNLARWVRDAGGAAALCRDKQLSKSYPSYISQTIAGGSFAARGARNAEKKLDIPAGWLDRDHAAAAQFAPAPPPAVDLPSALAVVATALKHFPPARQAELLKAFDLLVSNPDEPDYAAMLAKLLSNAGPSASPEKRQGNGR